MRFFYIIPSRLHSRLSLDLWTAMVCCCWSELNQGFRFYVCVRVCVCACMCVCFVTVNSLPFWRESIGQKGRSAVYFPIIEECTHSCYIKARTTDDVNHSSTSRKSRTRVCLPSFSLYFRPTNRPINIAPLTQLFFSSYSQHEDSQYPGEGEVILFYSPLTYPFKSPDQVPRKKAKLTRRVFSANIVVIFSILSIVGSSNDGIGRTVSLWLFFIIRFYTRRTHYLPHLPYFLEFHPRYA